MLATTNYNIEVQKNSAAVIRKRNSAVAEKPRNAACNGAAGSLKTHISPHVLACRLRWNHVFNIFW